MCLLKFDFRGTFLEHFDLDTRTRSICFTCHWDYSISTHHLWPIRSTQWITELSMRAKLHHLLLMLHLSSTIVGVLDQKTLSSKWCLMDDQWLFQPVEVTLVHTMTSKPSLMHTTSSVILPRCIWFLKVKWSVKIWSQNFIFKTVRISIEIVPLLIKWLNLSINKNIFSSALFWFFYLLIIQKLAILHGFVVPCKTYHRYASAKNHVIFLKSNENRYSEYVKETTTPP